MKKVIKLVVVTNELPIDICRMLEQNGCKISSCEVVEPSWEQVWNGFIEANQKYQDENKQAQESNLKLTEQEFIHKYCYPCGTQRCEGIGTEWFNGCLYRHELEGYEGE